MENGVLNYSRFSSITHFFRFFFWRDNVNNTDQSLLCRIKLIISHGLFYSLMMTQRHLMLDDLKSQLHKSLLS